MPQLWLQFEIISKATTAQIRLRRNLRAFEMSATGDCFGIGDRFGYLSENSPKNLTLESDSSGLPKTTDHQQLKI